MTLDQALADIVEIKQSAHLKDIMNPESWNKENRDEMYQKVVDVNNESIDSSLELINTFLNKEVKGVPLMIWYIRQYSLQTVLQLLMELREQLDAMEDDRLNDFPFDYDWLNSKIREIYSQLRDVSRSINISQYLDNTKTEDL